VNATSILSAITGSKAFPFQLLRAAKHEFMNASLLDPLPPAREIPSAFTASLKSWYVLPRSISGFLSFVSSGGLSERSRVQSAKRGF
jgi:hypothetical protein